MSRIGNAPITIPEGTTVTINNGRVIAKGVKGEHALEIPSGLTIKQEANVLFVELKRADLSLRAIHGTTRALLANAVYGVTHTWTKVLELSGVGYRATMNGESVVLNVGFSHPVHITPPIGIQFEVKEGTIIVSGVDKFLVGLVASKIREVKKPEPYKGKGIRYKGEYIRKKVGKAKAVGAGGGASTGK